tara:strand:- start:121 stop:924 length:804 start_codon:yes stop_codon:yes gene_type:complete
MSIVQIPLKKEFMPFGNILPYEIQRKILNERMKILEKERKEMITSLTDEELMTEAAKRNQVKKRKNMPFGLMFKTRNHFVQVQCHDIIDIVEWIESQFEHLYSVDSDDEDDVESVDNSSGIGEDDEDQEDEESDGDESDEEQESDDEENDDESDEDEESEEDEDPECELFSTAVFGPDPAYCDLRDLAYNAWRNFDDVTKSIVAADLFENFENPYKLILCQKNNIRELLDEEVKGINCIQYIMKCFRSERYKMENEKLVINEDIKAV